MPFPATTTTQRDRFDEVNSNYPSSCFTPKGEGAQAVLDGLIVALCGGVGT
jgi:hypothetical protein